MYSKARLGKRPIHPMLVIFPLALYAATVGALLANIGTEDPFWYRFALATDVAGVGMALIAMIPGAIDLLSLKLPRATRAVGIRHAALNLTAAVLFAIAGALLYRGWTGRMMVDGEFALDATVPLAFAMIGLLATIGAGMLGYTLVQEHHVGVVPRPMVTPLESEPDPDDYEDSFDGLDYETPAQNPHDTLRNPVIHDTERNQTTFH